MLPLLLPEPLVKKNGWPWAPSDYNFSSCKDTWPKITIVTPSFNQGKYIEETIRSVLQQNYPNLEFVIIDGGSTDNTVDIIKRYEAWITYWVSEPDRGQSHAINKGLEKCSGHIINWLNSDDWLEPNALFEIANQFLENPNTLVVSGHENHVFEDGNLVEVVGTTLGDSLEATIERCHIAQPSTFFRSREFKLISPVPEDIHYIMDGEIWMRFLLMYGQKSFKKIDKPLVNFRLHENSKTVGNSEVDNFLFERSSIVLDLQNFVGVPPSVINYWREAVFKSPKILQLNRQWKINKAHITKKKLRTHFIKKYITQHFIQRNKMNALKGLKELVLNAGLDFFVVKAVIKILFKKGS